MSDFTVDQLKQIHQEATEAAQTAETAFRALHGEPGYCGFAWVNVPVKASTRLGRNLVAIGFRKSYGGGLDLWNPGGSFTQSMDIKECGSRAYAEIFRKHGIDAYMMSRAD